jgi:hypothetical protein
MHASNPELYQKPALLYIGPDKAGVLNMTKDEYMKFTNQEQRMEIMMSYLVDRDTYD